MPDYDLIAILGPTASGKTPFAASLEQAKILPTIPSTVVKSPIT